MGTQVHPRSVFDVCWLVAAHWKSIQAAKGKAELFRDLLTQFVGIIQCRASSCSAGQASAWFETLEQEPFFSLLEGKKPGWPALLQPFAGRAADAANDAPEMFLWIDFIEARLAAHAQAKQEGHKCVIQQWARTCLEPLVLPPEPRHVSTAVVQRAFVVAKECRASQRQPLAETIEGTPIPDGTEAYQVPEFREALWLALLYEAGHGHGDNKGSSEKLRSAVLAWMDRSFDLVMKRSFRQDKMDPALFDQWVDSWNAVQAHGIATE